MVSPDFEKFTAAPHEGGGSQTPRIGGVIIGHLPIALR
jgi:hypothetical protein